MLDLEAMRLNAEEGLRIANEAPAGPWVHRRDVGGRGVDEAGDNAGSDKFIVDAGANGTRPDLDFIADVRTRAPIAYADVLALIEEVRRLKRVLEITRDPMKLFGPEVSP